MRLSSERMLQRIQGLPDSQPFGADSYRDSVMVTWSAPTRLLRVRILFPVPWSDCLMVRHRPHLQLSGRRYCRRPSVSGDLISDEISATGGHQRFAPQPPSAFTQEKNRSVWSVTLLRRSSEIRPKYPLSAWYAESEGISRLRFTPLGATGLVPNHIQQKHNPL